MLVIYHFELTAILYILSPFLTTKDFSLLFAVTLNLTSKLCLGLGCAVLGLDLCVILFLRLFALLASGLLTTLIVTLFTIATFKLVMSTSQSASRFD